MICDGDGGGCMVGLGKFQSNEVQHKIILVPTLAEVPPSIA